MKKSDQEGTILSQYQVFHALWAVDKILQVGPSNRHPLEQTMTAD